MQLTQLKVNQEWISMCHTQYQYSVKPHLPLPGLSLLLTRAVALFLPHHSPLTLHRGLSRPTPPLQPPVSLSLGFLPCPDPSLRHAFSSFSASLGPPSSAPVLALMSFWRRWVG